MEKNWIDEFRVAVTVADKDGRILYMNKKSASTFIKNGGHELVGSNLRDCHKPESWEKIKEIISSERANCYTIEKEGVKKMIYQAPWYDGGELSGIVELSLEIPFDMEHFVRK